MLDHLPSPATTLRSIRNHYNKDHADILTKLHVLTILSGKQQTMSFYRNVGDRQEMPVALGLCKEIAQVEELRAREMAKA